jgi:CheY-like chemotaxis protein
MQRPLFFSGILMDHRFKDYYESRSESAAWGNAGSLGGRSMAKKLLVIDDQTGITKVVELIARQIGLDVRSLNSSAQATETFIAFRPDVLFLDMIMPEKDGIDVLNEILLTGIPVKVVLTSGYSDSYLRLAEGVAKFHDNPNVSVLRKPFRREELMKLLSDLTTD